jgi:hypothetical protein
MSYLRGPLTRQQVQILMAAQKQELMARLGMTAPQQSYGQTGGYAPNQTGANLPLPPVAGGTGAFPPLPPETGGYSAQAAPPATTPGFSQNFSQQVTVPPSQVGFSQAIPQGTQATVRGPAAPSGFNANPPPLASSTSQYFLPASVTSQQAITIWEQQTRVAIQSMGGASLAYKPVLLAQAAVRYQDRKTQLYTARMYSYQVPSLEKSGLVHWEEFLVQPIDSRRVSGEPFGVCIYGDLSPGLTDAKRMSSLKGELTDMLYNTARLVLPSNQTLGIFATPEADPSQFPAQVQQVARERRDAEIDQLAAKYEKLLDSLDEKIRRKERELSLEKRELADRKREEFFTRGEALLSLFKGRTTYTLSRTSRSARMKNQTKGQLTESEEVIADLEDQMDAAKTKFEAEIQSVNDRWAKVATDVQDYTITPLKKDIQVELFGIGWIPYYFVEVNGQPLLLPGM